MLTSRWRRSRDRRIELPRKATLGAAFQVIGRSVLYHIAANEPAVLAGLPDGVHQMRVGVRRLRAAIWVFSDLLRSQQTETIRQDLKWLAGKLGPVRDFDVFPEHPGQAAGKPPTRRSQVFPISLLNWNTVARWRLKLRRRQSPARATAC